MWRRKLNGASVLFFCNRYICGVLTTLYGYSPLTEQVCTHFIHSLGTVLTVADLDVSLQANKPFQTDTHTS